jgi:SAM-dependent methyltransferase
MKSEIFWVLRFQISETRKLITKWRMDWTALQKFWRSYKEYQRISPPSMQPSLNYIYPCLGDDTTETQIEPIYFYQDAWAFERIIQQQPESHVDVGSHHKFVALLSIVISVTMIDFRPLSLPLDSLRFQKGSILELPFEDNSILSVSSLCVIEHIGLGRYGDPLDFDGTEKAITELKRILAPGGTLYLSVPIDDENRTYFNAHRAFNEDYLFELFKPLQVLEKRYIFGNSFSDQPKTGFGVGCYFLRK